MSQNWLAIAAGSVALTLSTAGLWAQTTLPAPARPSAAAPKPNQAGPVLPAARVESAFASVANVPKTGESIRVLLAPERETTLSSPVAARIKQLNVSLGAAFSAGQLLASFDCDEPLARMNMAKAELGGAVETHEAKVRMQGLEQASDVEVALAASAVDKARAQEMLYLAQIRQCSVTAPWAGRVSKVHVRNYMGVTPGQPLVDLVKSGPLKLRLNVPSRVLAAVKVGQLFEVSIDETGKAYQARVSAINSRVDPVSQTIELEADMTKMYADLLPGMSGTANLAAPHNAR